MLWIVGFKFAILNLVSRFLRTFLCYILIYDSQMVFQTGNQDLCYYNFLCAHPIGPLADFNHVYSNIGYIILGMAFMVQARCRHVKYGESQVLHFLFKNNFSYELCNLKFLYLFIILVFQVEVIGS